jgi:hypothetical protein
MRNRDRRAVGGAAIALTVVLAPAGTAVLVIPAGNDPGNAV